MNGNGITSGGEELRGSLTLMAAQLHPDLLRQSLQGGLRRVATVVRNQARTAYAAAVPGLGTRADKAITYKVHRDLSGLRVRVMHTTDAAMVTNSKGKKKPLPFWFEHGTVSDRRTRKTNAPRGGIPAAKVMERMADAYTAERLETMLLPDIESAAGRILKRLGL